MGTGAPRAIAATAFVAVAAACSYDWTIRDSSAPDSGPTEKDAAAPIVDSSVTNADADESASDAALSVDAGSCASLAAALAPAQLAARTGCTVGMACTSTVTDQCGCALNVADPSSQATRDFVIAVSSFDEAGCPNGCGTCPQAGPTACLQGPGPDGGFVSTCQEP